MDTKQWKEDTLKVIDKKLEKDFVKMCACLGVGAFLIGRSVMHGINCGVSHGFTQMLELCEPVDRDSIKTEEDD